MTDKHLLIDSFSLQIWRSPFASHFLICGHDDQLLPAGEHLGRHSTNDTANSWCSLLQLGYVQQVANTKQLLLGLCGVTGAVR